MSSPFASPSSRPLPFSPTGAVIASELAKSYDGATVLDGVSFSAPPRHRVGLVGENGAGKSTLLRLLAGIEEPDSGTLARPPDTGLLHQEPPHPPDTTVGGVLEAALAELRAAERELARRAERLERAPGEPQAMADYAELLEWAEAHQLWEADHRADLVLDGLGLAGVARSRRIGELSGGERSRLALAALLVRQPRALLLDEPTNHLDDDAIAFLEGHLAALPGAVVLASHDRVFLDAVCTGLLDLDPSRDGPTWYGGAYTDYLRAKRTERRRWEERWAAEQEELAELRESVRTTARQVAPGRAMRDRAKMAYDYSGGRVQRQVSRRVRNARRRLEELTREQVRKPRPPLRFAGVLTGGSGGDDGPAVRLRGAEVPGRLVLDRLDVPSQGRLLVTGPNGAGKSTLLALLAGRLAPARGTVAHRRGIRVRLLEQDVRFDRPERTAGQVYAEALGERAPERPPLRELGLIAPRDLDRPVGLLSAGQRRRLALAVAVADAPQLLLLDEPTNHLSLALAEELEEALRTAPGAIVVASHDRWLRRDWTGAVLHLEAGRPAALRPPTAEEPRSRS
ncbi:ABC-F family ATP-binding cassette domain-containing protein [Allonocardiopsis opalescens]|uniref:Macrolide transport system ATP-binding/permease protein n=1 Tax=Allonocardiopsis opalescens TaxID=1144618 RepID=A0A2T0Q6S4_9ACTN|nr:ATP-binding cassette domain-containing protein [Allonocardiopsis opalescens]PRX99530.1 macrolide transport system ATP-binding/permease protein [Allonocardiopsis opalescens]